MRFAVTALFVAVTLGLASPAQAQNEMVQVQMDAAEGALAEQGFAPVGESGHGALREGNSNQFEVQLPAGKYVVIGVCDSDCSDVNLVLRDASGGEIDVDRLPDDVPVVGAEIDASETLQVRVEMAACSVEPCYWGARVYRNTQP